MVKLSRAQYDQLVKQARDEFPLECCGLLAGRKIQEEIIVNKIFPGRNMDQSSEHFTMDPKEQFAALKEMRNEGLELVGNYHSHPYTPSRPSEEDKRLAYDPGILYAIISLKEKEPVLNFFKIATGEFVEELEYLLT
ncbi:M67 family metallopeptidase [Metallumcola ferriviriculae]|uniref:M67 family metallopeptidase n=1 Tax=Metallumcola ferriviriculae TaxID=3039180 RepID=UPI0034599516